MATEAETEGRVDVVHTHASVVFLTAEHAFKVKKPVKFAFLEIDAQALKMLDRAGLTPAGTTDVLKPGTGFS